MKGAKENSPPPKLKSVAQAAKTSTSTPSEISEIMFSISQLANTLGTLVTDRKNDRILLEANMKSINDIQSLKSSTTPMSPVINPLDHMDDTFPTTRRESRRSSYDVAMKLFPIESADTKNINFLYSPVMSDLELKYLSVSNFLIFWKNFVILQQKHPEQILQLGNFLSPKVIEELIADLYEYDGSDFETHVRGGQLNLHNSEIYPMIIKKISPRTKEIFILTLNRNLTFPTLPSGYIVSVNMYRPMYLALLAWQTNFFFLYDLLITDLRCELPQFRTRNGVKGILDSFLDPIPQEHGHNLLRALNFDQVKNMKDIKSDFIPVFMAFIKQIYTQHTISLDLNLTTGMYVPPSYSKKKNDIPHNPHKLSYLPQSDTSVQNPDNDYYEDFLIDSNHFGHESLSSDPASSALNVIDTLQKKPLPCFVMMRTGKCSKGNACTYSHITKDLVMCWQSVFNDLKSSPFNSRLHPNVLSETSPPHLKVVLHKQLRNMTVDTNGEIDSVNHDSNNLNTVSSPSFLD